MTLRVLFRRAAKDEFEDAAAWYEGRRRGLGEQFVSEVGEAIEKAAERPQQHPVGLWRCAPYGISALSFRGVFPCPWRLVGGPRRVPRSARSGNLEASSLTFH